MANFLLATEIRDRLDEIIALNPEAKLVADSENGDWLVLDNISTELDHDGDAHFTLRSYATGDTVAVTTYEKS
jgi:hypothetical protein